MTNELLTATTATVSVVGLRQLRLRVGDWHDQLVDLGRQADLYCAKSRCVGDVQEFRQPAQATLRLPETSSAPPAILRRR
ncbi:hypothetical protein [Kutzneria buriramensis]|uniref:Uncharacterized protein n=1 Tax=Kutzneria buriramensis TaxID=1045776 RepID=A0A3E0H0M2_9PSEU|nr:hypothetical protein [Kutzneria buriramensis]REH36368.1 hypothetical protein BCF44_116238 [Kutzneria buriramensis]